MRLIHREFFNISRGSVFHIIPLGDVHLISAACDEELFKAVVKRIEDDEHCFWIGMGDYADWINIHDWRFDAATLAKWVTIADLVDLAKVQEEKFLDLTAPIARKCLAMVEGNHERTLKQKTERDVYSNIVTATKQRAKLPESQHLGVGFSGWLKLSFFRDKKKRQRGKQIRINLHHGFVGGKLAGAKALNMQRRLWTHDCDICLMGHSHNTSIYREAVEKISGNKIITQTRFGAYTGTFLRNNIVGTSTYSEIAGYFPLPLGGVEIELRPGAENRHIKLSTSSD